jgi:hypothetical protein
MLAASVWALGVHRAAPGTGIEEVAISAGAPRQGKQGVLEVEMVYQARFAQTLGDLLGCLVLGLKRIDHAQTQQIGQAHLHRHGAAIGRTALAQAWAIATPSLQPIDINQGK